jgi:hypothetical protein
MRCHPILIASGLWLGQLPACSDQFSSGSNTGGQGQAGTGGVSGGGSASEGGSGGHDPAGGAGEGGVGQAAAAGDAGHAGDANAGNPVGGESGAGGAPPAGCDSLDDCPAGQNCVEQACVPALVSCAAHKNSYPASKDGVYWIAVSGDTQRVYCDMLLSTELCGEVAAEHQGRTRDKAAIGYTMTSVLLLSEGVCKIWAIRGTDTGHPFDRLQAQGGVPAGQTCISLGFAADGKLGSCPYGSQRTNCGFPAMPLHRYGNYCTGCTLNDGAFDRWTLQGPVSSGEMLSTMSGTTFTTCATERR